LSTLTSMALEAGILYWQARRQFRYEVDWTLLLKVLLASVGFIVAALLLPPRTIWTLAGDGILGGILYVGGLLLLRVIKLEEVLAYVANVRTRRHTVSAAQ
jgi:peptidoglycan biosynthesis protein MviN/MurJ (putative lipid II flippase)